MRRPSNDKKNRLANQLASRLTVQFAPDQIDQLRALAATRGVGVSMIVREMVTKGLAQVDEKAGQPAREATPE